MKDSTITLRVVNFEEKDGTEVEAIMVLASDIIEFEQVTTREMYAYMFNYGMLERLYCRVSQILDETVMPLQLKFYYIFSDKHIWEIGNLLDLHEFLNMMLIALD